MSTWTPAQHILALAWLSAEWVAALGVPVLNCPGLSEYIPKQQKLWELLPSLSLWTEACMSKTGTLYWSRALSPTISPFCVHCPLYPVPSFG